MKILIFNKEGVRFEHVLTDVELSNTTDTARAFAMQIDSTTKWIRVDNVIYFTHDIKRIEFQD